MSPRFITTDIAVSMNSCRPSLPFLLGTLVGIIISTILLDRMDGKNSSSSSSSWPLPNGDPKKRLHMAADNNNNNINNENNRESVFQRYSLGGKAWSNVPLSFANSSGVESFEKHKRQYRQNSPLKRRPKRKKRKAFIDCGGNTASSVDLFLDTYPGGQFDSFSFNEKTYVHVC